jgi:hypothetical protein
MTIRRSIWFALLALGCTGPVLAADPEPAPAREQTADNGSEVVCRVLKVTGSRLSNQRTCLTRDQWRQQRQDQRDETDRAQRQKSYTDGAG